MYKRQEKTKETNPHLLSVSNKVIQAVTVGNLNKPVGKRLAAKHIYNEDFVSKPKTAEDGDSQSKNNMKIHKFNARQVGRIGGKRKSEGSEKGTNTVFNVTVSNLENHLKTDFTNNELSTINYKVDTRNYKFATGVAGDKLMAFGGIQNGTGELHTNNKNDNIYTRFDHLQSTNPLTPLNQAALGGQAGGWLVKQGDFTETNWKKLTDSRDKGFDEGKSAADRAALAAGDN